MDENSGLAFKKRSLGDFMGQFATDIQGGQYNYLRYPQNHFQQNQWVGHDFPNENIDPSMRNFLFPESYQSSPGGHYILNSGNDMLPAMVEVGGGNYVVYGTPNAQLNQNMPNMTNVHFLKNISGTISGYNEYGVDYSGADYNLMRGMSPQSHSGVSPQFPQHDTETNCKAQLIENLVGNWASYQSGIYSPFGTSLGGIRTFDCDSIGLENGNKKPRIVAEVRPMRPSYSDVLSKSITNNQKSNKTVQDLKPKVNDIKVKNTKSNIARTLSGNGNILNRQHSTGVDDSTLTNLNSTLKKTVYKKQDIENEENLSKKWVSLDDLKESSRQEKYINLNDMKNRKNSSKTTCNKQNKKEKWESIQLNNSKNVLKKQEKVKQPGGMKKEESSAFNVRNDTTKMKSNISEERRGTQANQNKSEQPKSSSTSSSSRRNPRSCPVEKPKKLQKNKRKEQEPCLSNILKQRFGQYGGILLRAINWFLQLVMDVLGLSTHLAIHMCGTVWASALINSAYLYKKFSRSIRNVEFFQRLFNAPFGRFKNGESKKNKTKTEEDFDESGEARMRRKIPRGLKHNTALPVTGDEAMKRLLACKGKDPYSILGLTPDCTDGDIKKYYKRQAFLVHPDKNTQPGAEEAFKILVHAFNLIGKPELRKMYDHKVEKIQFEQDAWDEVNVWLSRIQKKMEYVANTIRCTNCKKRHKRTVVDRPIYAARVCAQCKIHHSVREGDIWAEASFFGLIWRYYACMYGTVYDITEWASCQGSNLKNLKANTHNVQYRIVLGKQHKQRYQQTASTSEPYIEEFINNFYARSDSRMAGPDADYSTATGRKRKSKGKK